MHCGSGERQPMTVFSHKHDIERVQRKVNFECSMAFLQVWVSLLKRNLNVSCRNLAKMSENSLKRDLKRRVR